MPDRRIFLATLGGALLGASAPSPTPSPSPSPTPEPPLPGRTFLPQLSTAPFPHPSRPKYHDSTVGIYVPAGFRPGTRTDFVVHFHGWRNHVTEVFRRYELREQLEESGRNAVLVVPQGPPDMPDSGDGKLELDVNGFARFIADVARYVHEHGVTPNANVGRIVLSSHSGGYGAVGGILTRGGMNAQITDVILVDSAYAYFDAMANWTKSSPENHLLSVFTDDTSLGNTELMARLQGVRRYQVLNAQTMTLAQLQTRDATFIYTTDVAHDELLQKYHWYALFLKATALELSP
jgi:hypothetical protein